MAASLRHGLSTDGGGLVGGTLGGEPSVSASDSNRNPHLERMAKRPNDGSCLIRFETKFKLGRTMRNEGSPGEPRALEAGRAAVTLREPRKLGETVLQSFNTVSPDARADAGVTERLMGPTADRFLGGSTPSPGTS